MSTPTPVPLRKHPTPARARRPGAPPGAAARRTGHVVGALVNVALLVALLVWPGWEVLPFLTEAFTDVVGLLTLSLAAMVLAETLYAMTDRRRVRAVGDLVTLSLSLVVTVRLLQVFPFAFGDGAPWWPVVVRVLLVLAVVGTVIGMIAATVQAARSSTGDVARG